MFVGWFVVCPGGVVGVSCYGVRCPGVVLYCLYIGGYHIVWLCVLVFSSFPLPLPSPSFFHWLGVVWCFVCSFYFYECILCVGVYFVGCSVGGCMLNV